MSGPGQPIAADGTLHLGRYHAPFAEVDLAALPLRCGRWRLPRPVAALRAKAWQHIAVVTPRYLIGMAWVDAAYLKTSWLYVYDRERAQAFEHHRRGPRLDLRVNHRLGDGRNQVRARGYAMSLHNFLSEGEHTVHLAVDGQGDKASVQGTLRCDAAHTLPLVVVLPAGPQGAMVSYKAPLPCSGELWIGDERHRLDPEQCTAIFDVHHARYPHRTQWQWATCVGRSGTGERVALNLTTNATNPDEARLNENALWLGERCFPLAAARFVPDPRGASHAWRLGTVDHQLSLSFIPTGGRQENLNALVLRSRFAQRHGSFAGVFHSPQGVVEIPNAYGLLEDHLSHW